MSENEGKSKQKKKAKGLSKSDVSKPKRALDASNNCSTTSEDEDFSDSDDQNIDYQENLTLLQQLKFEHGLESLQEANEPQPPFIIVAPNLDKKRKHSAHLYSDAEKALSPRFKKSNSSYTEDESWKYSALNDIYRIKKNVNDDIQEFLVSLEKVIFEEQNSEKGIKDTVIESDKVSIRTLLKLQDIGQRIFHASPREVLFVSFILFKPLPILLLLLSPFTFIICTKTIIQKYN
jgi:hypothetical protein